MALRPPWGILRPELIGERLVDGEYRTVPLHTDAEGILRGHSELLGLDICVRPGLELRLYDPAGGQWLLAPAEAYAAHQSAEEENRRLREQLRRLQEEGQ